MRVMVIVKATRSSEAGAMPSEQLLADMGKYNEELVKAGIMVSGDGLHPSSRGKRVRFAGSARTVIDGPFAETKELIAGYWIWQVKSMNEALEWVKRCPDPMPGEESELEIRPIFAPEDFGDALTPELLEGAEHLRVEIERRRAAGTGSLVDTGVAATRGTGTAAGADTPAGTGAGKIFTHLWYAKDAEEAAAFYVSIFPSSRVDRVTPLMSESPSGPAGTVKVVDFTLFGQRFQATSAGPHHDFNDAISIVVRCGDQAEVDRYWNAFLAGGGKPQACGWLIDRFGVRWQIVPAALDAMMRDADPVRSKKVTDALLKMVKLDIAALERAYRS
jgi:predicted 3-demethylubiquinone-9 3-methyltransferase (glyoxalase superfamily)